MLHAGDGTLPLFSPVCIGRQGMCTRHYGRGRPLAWNATIVVVCCVPYTWYELWRTALYSVDGVAQLLRWMGSKIQLVEVGHDMYERLDHLTPFPLFDVV